MWPASGSRNHLGNNCGPECRDHIMEEHIEQSTVDRQGPVDYGVQIRFINDLQETHKSKKAKKNVAKSGSYGVMVRVQGISGQPYVVLNNSDGVSPAPGAQYRTDSVRDSIPEENGSVVPGTYPEIRGGAKELDVPENPYGDTTSSRRPTGNDSQCSTSDDEAGSRHYVRLYDSEAYLRSSRNAGSYESVEGHMSLPRRRPAHPEEQLRKSHSQGSLLNLEEEPFPLDLPSGKRGDQNPRSSVASTSSEQSGSSGRGKMPGYSNNLYPDEPRANLSVSSSTSWSKPPSKASSATDVSLQSNDTSAIDTKPLSSVDSLISKFDRSGGQQRGRTARRNRITAGDQKRSQSLDNRVSTRRSSSGLELKKEPDWDERFETPGGQKPFRSGDVMDVCKDVSYEKILEARPPVVTKESPPQTQLAPPVSSADNRFPSKPAKEPAHFPTFNASSLPRKWSQNRTEVEPVVERSRNAAVFTERTMQLKSTPDLLRDQQGLSPASEEPTKQLLFKILKEGSVESDSFLRKKTSLVFDKFQGMKYAELSPDLQTLSTRNSDLEKKIAELQRKLDEELMNHKDGQRRIDVQDLQIQLEETKEERDQLHSLYQKNRKELQGNIQELMKLKMEKETVEAEMRDLQDEMAAMHKELKSSRKSTGDSGDTEILSELARTKEELDMVATAKQTVEDILRQKERELTALKGVLKEEVSSHDKAMEDLTAQYQKDMEQLRKNFEEVSQTQQNVESERQKINSTMRNLQRQLEESTEETVHWKEMFQKNREELRHTKQELMQIKLEKEEFDEELRDLRDRYSVMQDEVDHVKRTSVDNTEIQSLKKELLTAKKELQEMARNAEHQEALLQRKEQELSALKGTLSEEAANHSKALDKLKQSHQKEVDVLKRNCDLMSKDKLNLENEKGATEQAKKAADSSLKQLRQDNEDLKRKVSQMDFQMGECKDEIEELKASESRLKDRAVRLEAERKQMELSLGEVTEKEQEMAINKRMLENRLEETQRNLNRLTQDHQELTKRFQDETRQKDQLRKVKNELEEQKRLLDKTIEKLQKEVDEVSKQSGNSVVVLQSQLDEYRDKSRRELTEHQRQAKERALELEKANVTIKRLQDEAGRLKQDLQQSNAEKENALLDKDLLSQRLQNLEQDVEAKRRTQDDKLRMVKVLEVSEREILSYQYSWIILLLQHPWREREQINQLRAELMQERAARQDLECDKISLERQVKDLKIRLSNSEGTLKPNANLSQLESRIRELEDRLQSEERDRSALQASNRKLERKVKELTIQLDDERQQVSDEKDQLTLRVKALKRQVDEAEEEIERLETARKKSLRELEDLHEVNEQLQNRIKSLEKDVWLFHYKREAD
ncbi:cingulin-like [Chiloscyllium plagiosum]|uniref:cingulin-like n=1 Tax=Chiloscyllium plagiosum TaxID=36176 RepID=UPI001CB7AE54|nr:cingulin-like [Chiloscyllium plagiosum]